MPSQMNDLFDQIHKLPQIAEVIRVIINQLSDPNAAMQDVAKNVEKEQVVALKILRLVNSAHFGLSRKISSIEEATSLLGANQLKTLVIASGIVSAIPNIPNFDIKQFWNNSFRSATVAKWFAEQASLSGDIAYTAGLISNLGNLLIHMGAQREANEIDQHVKSGSSRIEIERRRLGYTSLEVTAELCRRWKFADELIETIEHCGEPLLEQASSLSAAVYLGRYISLCHDQNKSYDEIAEDFPLSVANKLGLTTEFIVEKLTEVLAIESNLVSLAD